MTGTRPAEILRHLEQSSTPDGELLARFAATKDAAAFAELVRRHAALVLGVCRRVTSQEQDAEEAFQATFLVLAKKAGAVRNAALLGNWLYGVAFRVAWRAKRSASRRRAREVLVAALPDTPAPAVATGASELQPILDEELAALPACYRDAIILCDLQGRSREEAAGALGIPEGTLSSRLASGRKKLAARLTKRGVVLSAAALPLAVVEAQAAVAVPNDLLTKTCGLVADWAAGGAVPGTLARLAEGGLAVRKMLVFGAVMLVSVAGAVLAAQPREAPPADPPKPPLVAEKPAEQPPKSGPEAKPAEKPIVAYTSAPRLSVGWDLPISNGQTAIWSPDGTTIAVIGTDSSELKNQKSMFYLVKYPGKSEPQDRIRTLLSKDSAFVGFTPDGKQAITALREYGLLSGYHRLTWWDPSKAEQSFAPSRPFVLRVEAKVRTLDFDGANLHTYAFTADGKTFRSIRFDYDANEQVYGRSVVEVDAVTGKTGKVVLKLDPVSPSVMLTHSFSPDGKRLAVFDKGFSKVTVHELDKNTKLFEHTFAAEKPARGQLNLQIVYSQDGHRLVVSRGLGQVFVLNADTGATLPTLERIENAITYPAPQAFSGDGRLLALCGDHLLPGQKNSFGPGPQPRSAFLTVWDTQTGKVVKSWDRSPSIAFCPTRPVLAMLEPNGEDTTRIGFWDFSAEAAKK